MKTRATFLIVLLSCWLFPSQALDAAVRYSIRANVLLRNDVGHELERTAVFRYTEGEPTDIHSTLTVHVGTERRAEYVSPNLTTDEPLAISNAGNIAGFRFSYAVSGERQNRHYFVTGKTAFAYVAGAPVDVHASLIAKLGNASTRIVASQASAVNDRGEIVGWFAADGDSADYTHGFLYRNGDVMEIGASNPEYNEALAINATTVVVGTRGSAETRRNAFVFANGARRDLIPRDPRHTASEAAAINDAGHIVGNFSLPGGRHAFVHSNGSLRDLGTLGGSTSRALDIDSRGVVVGQASDATGVLRAFIVIDGQMHDLNAFIDPNDTYAHLHFEEAIAIYDDGVIAARARDSFNQLQTFWLIPNTPNADDDLAEFNFENGLQGWRNFGEPIVSLSNSTLERYAGQKSLAVTFQDDGFASIAVPRPTVTPGRTVTFRVFLPADATLEWLQPFVLEDESGGWRWAGNWQPLTALTLGAWNTLNVALPSDAHPLWALGIEFFAPSPYQGTVFIDSVDF